jgi:hypothetical protein
MKHSEGHRYVNGHPSRGRRAKHVLDPGVKLHPRDNLLDYNRRTRKYPWKEWLDGSWWEAVKGQDYTCATIDFLRYLQVVATRYGYRVQSFRQPHGRSVMFQFYRGPKRKVSAPFYRIRYGIPEEGK